MKTQLCRPLRPSAPRPSRREPDHRQQRSGLRPAPLHRLCQHHQTSACLQLHLHRQPPGPALVGECGRARHLGKRQQLPRQTRTGPPSLPTNLVRPRLQRRFCRLHAGNRAGLDYPTTSAMAAQFSENTVYTNKGFSSYNGLLLTLHKNASHGLTFDFELHLLTLHRQRLADRQLRRFRRLRLHLRRASPARVPR